MKRGFYLKYFLWDLIQGLCGSNSTKKRLLGTAIRQPCSILEIGCATGNIAGMFAASDYTGIDTDQGAIRAAAAKYTARNYRFVCGDITAEVLSGAAYDYVLLSHVVHHVPNQVLHAILRRAEELLAIGGRVVILDMERPGVDDSLPKRLYRRFDRGRFMRTKNEMVARIQADTKIEVERAELHATYKYGLRIIDQYLIIARK